MQVRLFLLMIIFFNGLQFASCFFANENKETTEPAGIKVIMSLPMPNESNKIENVRDSLFVFSYGNRVVYKMPEIFTKNVVQVDSTGEVIGQKAIPEIRYSYFIYDTSKADGIRYDSANAIQGRKMPVDTFLNTYGVHSFLLSADYLDRNKLVDSLTDAKETRKIYAVKNKKNKFSNDSLYLYYNSGITNNTIFSLSLALNDPDVKNLYKVSYFYNARFDENQSINIPERELFILLKVVDLKMHPEVFTMLRNSNNQ